MKRRRKKTVRKQNKKLLISLNVKQFVKELIGKSFSSENYGKRMTNYNEFHWELLYK